MSTIWTNPDIVEVTLLGVIVLLTFIITAVVITCAVYISPEIKYIRQMRCAKEDSKNYQQEKRYSNRMTMKGYSSLADRGMNKELYISAFD